LALANIMLAYWQPLEGIIWGKLDTEFVGYLGIIIGWCLSFSATWMIDHWDLTGVRQSCHMGGPPTWREPMLYKWIRHPIFLGFFIQLWCRPFMTVGSLIFGLMGSMFVVVGSMLYERDREYQFPGKYVDYRKRVGTFCCCCPMCNPLMPKGEEYEQMLKDADDAPPTKTATLGDMEAGAQKRQSEIVVQSPDGADRFRKIE